MQAFFQKTTTKTVCIALLFSIFSSTTTYSQKGGDDTNFKIIVENKCSAVKDQGYSGTCWSYASISFLESEIKRRHNRDVDLAEWFIVRNIYPEKVRNYIRTEGNTFLTAGGQTQDVFWVLENVGLVPEQSFPGPWLNGQYNSAILDTAVMDFATELEWDKNGLISTNWESQLESLLNAQLGEKLKTFTQEGKKYTPMQYKESLDIAASDYIQVTSFNHHSFYAPFALESKYNWSLNNYMNLPLEEFMSSLDAALKNGYTVAVNIDVSEDSFEPTRTGIIDVEYTRVNQEKRQELFENGKTRVDHIMHIIGIAERGGKTYYITKNSWGNIGPLNGYVYLSENYIRSKSMSHTMHKDALSADLREKIGE